MELGHEAIDAVGADTAEGDFGRLADLALAGEMAQLADALSRLPGTGADAIPIIRSLQRRLLMLAPARARMERGESAEAVMASLGKSLFWKDKPAIAKMLSQWDADRLARVSDRAGMLERALMFSPAPQQETLGEELLAIAREARRR
jgi:DNA polymerase-3 subunit delta